MHRPEAIGSVSGRRALAGTVAAVWAGTAGGCRSASTAPAVPTPSRPTVRLVWQPWRVGWGKGWDQVFYEATQSFRNQHPGIDIVIDPAVASHSWSDDGFVVTQILSGTAPDVFSGFGPENLVENGYLLDLTASLRAANFDLSVFDKAQVDHYHRGTGLYALPAELSTTALAVNLDILDQLGLAYPDPHWDFQQASDLWVRSTVRGKRVGATFWSEGGNCPGNYYWQGWSTDLVDAADPARCIADRQPSLAFADWFYDLYSAGAAAFSGDFATGRATCATTGSWTLPTAATQWRAIKYDFYPYPSWPSGQTAYAGRDYYAVPINAPHPEEAATFLIWLMSVEWQRTMMQLQLVIPSIRTLWQEWATVVRQVAPPLAKKNLEAFTAAAFVNRAFTKTAFAYASDRAYGLLFGWTQKISTRQIDVRGGLTQGAAQVNAFEQSMATQARRLVDATRRFPTAGPAMAAVPTGI
jgi:ABC-type glycerol-3-phosphate transport system substrate-binding protein